MGKSKFRVFIKHYFLRTKTLSETKAKLDKYYSKSAPSYGIVQKWFTEFRCGRTSTETIPSPGRPNEINKPKMINKIHDTTSEQNLAYFNRSPKYFLLQFVTMDEKWIHHYTSESREGSKLQWSRTRPGPGPVRYRWPRPTWRITDRPTHQYPRPSGYLWGCPSLNEPRLDRDRLTSNWMRDLCERAPRGESDYDISLYTPIY